MILRLIGAIALGFLIHGGIVNSLLLATGRIRLIGEPKRPNILLHPLCKIGLALAVVAAITMAFPMRDPFLVIQMCVGVLLIAGDIILVWKAVTET